MDKTDTAEWTPGKQLKYWREQSGLYMHQVADKLRMSQQAISNWEGDVAVPRVRILDLIDELYGLKPGMVAAVTDKRNPPHPPAGVVEPRVVDMDDDGTLIWWGLFPADQMAAASGVSLEGLSRANQAKALEYIEFLHSQGATKKK